MPVVVAGLMMGAGADGAGESCDETFGPVVGAAMTAGFAKDDAGAGAAGVFGGGGVTV